MAGQNQKKKGKNTRKNITTDISLADKLVLPGE